MLPTHPRPNRSVSYPIATASMAQSRELHSIEEEHHAVEDPATHASQKSLLVSGMFESERLSSLQMSGISPHQSHSHRHEESVGRTSTQCTELCAINSSPHPSMQASLRQSQEHSLKQANGPSCSVQVSNQAVSFEVGGDISAPSTLPHDVDSQLNFPMDNNPPSLCNTPEKVRSKPANPNPADSLIGVMTTSLQQANEWASSNTPLLITTDKTSIQATDQGSKNEIELEACFVASQGKLCPLQPNPSSLPTAIAPETKREVPSTNPAPVTPTADGVAATASVECKCYS